MKATISFTKCSFNVIFSCCNTVFKQSVVNISSSLSLNSLQKCLCNTQVLFFSVKKMQHNQHSLIMRSLNKIYRLLSLYLIETIRRREVKRGLNWKRPCVWLRFIVDTIFILSIMSHSPLKSQHPLQLIIYEIQTILNKQNIMKKPADLIERYF